MNATLDAVRTEAIQLLAALDTCRTGDLATELACRQSLQWIAERAVDVRIGAACRVCRDAVVRAAARPEDLVRQAALVRAVLALIECIDAVRAARAGAVGPADAPSMSAGTGVSAAQERDQ